MLDLFSLMGPEIGMLIIVVVFIIVVVCCLFLAMCSTTPSGMVFCVSFTFSTSD